MEHSDAVKLQLCEKYVFGELTPDLRAAFEDHFFDCTVCAEAVHAATNFAAGSRQIFGESSAPQRTFAAEPARPVSGNVSGWFAWLRPAFAVPVMALLLLVVGYQNLVTLPHYKELAIQSESPRVMPTFSLLNGNTRSDSSTAATFRVHANESFGIYVDVPVTQGFSTYTVQLEDPSGHSSALRTLTSEEAQKTQVVQLNSGSSGGTYTLHILGAAPGQSAAATLLANMKFTVELIP